jgi:hypothetical protein
MVAQRPAPDPTFLLMARGETISASDGAANEKSPASSDVLLTGQD